jgi:predicted SAM-dependent methyltransferase
VAEVYADIRNLKLSDDLVDEIFTSHVFEHFTRWQAEEMLIDWFRIIKPGGRLVIETPDFWRCVLWLFHPSREKRSLGRTQFYGNQWDRLDYETHRYLWSKKEMLSACKHAGFGHVVITHRTETHYPGRDMRVEAIK